MTPSEPTTVTRYDAPDGGDRMIFHEPCGPVLRAVLFFGAAVTFMAPWELLIRPGHPFELGALPFWFISAGALSIGLPLLVGAILGLDRTLTIDFVERRFEEAGRGQFGISLHRARPFDQLEDLAVVENQWSDGPVEWRVEARFRVPGKPWSIRTLTNEAAALALRDTIAARMAGPTRDAPKPSSN